MPQGSEQLFLVNTYAREADRQSSPMEANKRYNKARQEKRKQAIAAGFCQDCTIRPATLRRRSCEQCLMKAIIKGAFKFQRGRANKEATAARGGCYVDQFRPNIRSQWCNEILSRYNGKCFYTGIDISVGSTAGLDHMIPVSRVLTYGPAKVFCPENLVWCHKSINLLKGEMTAGEFMAWLDSDFIPLLQMAVARQSRSA